MLTIAVRGRSIVVSEGFEATLRDYANANFQQGKLKKKDAHLEPGLHQAEHNAWVKLYEEMTKMFETYYDDFWRSAVLAESKLETIPAENTEAAVVARVSLIEQAIQDMAVDIYKEKERTEKIASMIKSAISNDIDYEQLRKEIKYVAGILTQHIDNMHRRDR